MNMKKIALILVLALAALILSACGTPVSNNWPGLAADAERAYISTGSHIYAVDLEGGKEVWRYPAEADGKLLFFATPVIAPDGQLLIGSEGTNHAFVSVDAQTGRDNWSEPFSGAKGPWVASPLVVNDRIYAPNTDGFIYVLDLNGKAAGDPIEIGGALWSAPSSDGSLLYIASLDHHLHVIDPGQNTISEPIDLGGAAPSSPLAVENGAYVGSFSSRIEFISPAGRQEVVSQAANWVWGTPALDNETLYYADLDGNIYSYSLSSKRQNWDEVKPDGPVVAKLLVAGDQIYAATEAGTLVALDRDGKTAWEKNVGGKIYTSPVVSDGLVLVAPYQAEFALAAYDADGKQAWTFTPEK